MRTCIVIAACILVASVAFAQGKEELLQQGGELWLARSQSLENVDKAIELWKKAAELDPKDGTGCIDLSMGYYFLGRFADDKQAKMDLFTKGKEWGEEAVRRAPQSAASHYWLATNMAKWAQAHGKLKSLFVVRPMKAHLAEVLKIDETYYYGGGHRVLGKLLFEVPGLAGGDTKKGEEHLRSSLRIAPDYSLTMLFLSELLIDTDRKDEAKVLLQRILDLQPMPGFEQELKDDQGEAKRLLAGMK